ncbi:hypothetical protein E2986_13472 [Frieseomelitta varia]|uniref:Uncharacterized protein n=1 Tax=Frieseomelitta varia TaxID=561572 RepID=A0A833RQA6_9HYME|nr:hypothetical protein E2986_13472 [Frieseomelitta varia]
MSLFILIIEMKRRKQMEAAERRIAEQQSRGIKNIEAVKRQERLDQLREKRQEEVGNRNVQSNLRLHVASKLMADLDLAAILRFSKIYKYAFFKI